MRTFIYAAAFVIAGFVGGGVAGSAWVSPANFSDAQLVDELKTRGWQSASTDQTEALYFFESGDVNTHE